MIWNFQGKPFKFDYSVYFCKSFKMDQRRKKKKKSALQQKSDEATMFINAEGEILYKVRMGAE